MGLLLSWLRCTGTWVACAVLLPLGAAHAVPAGRYDEAMVYPEGWEEAAGDMNLGLLEPAAGESETDASATTIVPMTEGQPVTLPIEQLPRTRLAPADAANIALPAASPVSPTPGAGGIPLQQLYSGPQGRIATEPATADAAALGILVREGELGSGQGSLTELAAYGPLPTTERLNNDIWLKAGQAEQERRLQRALRQPLASPALREAWRSVLLLGAAAPAADTANHHWLAVRAEALEGQGLYEAAWSLWREASAHIRTQDISAGLLQGWTRAGLLAGQGAQVCPVVREQAAAGMVSDFWPAAAATCAALELPENGNPAALSLAIQLLPVEMAQSDPALLGALKGVLDNTTPRIGNWPISSLAGATLASAPQLLQPAQLGKLPDVVLRRIRQTPGLPENLTQTAALELVRQTAWPQDAAQWLTTLSSPTFPATPEPSWPDAAVLAWVEAWPSTISPTEISATLEASPSVPNAPLQVLRAPPEAAPLVVQAALRLGDLPTALNWWPGWMSRQLTSPEDIRQRWQAFMALRLAQGQPIEQAHLDAWRAVKSSENLNSQRVLAVLEGMGQTVPPAAWEGLDDTTRQADALNLAWQRLLEAAAQTRDVPATLSLISEGLQGKSPAGASPAALRAALLALRQLGWNELAVRMAAEALSLKPLPPRGAVLKVRNPDAEATPQAPTTAPKPSPSLVVPSANAASGPVAPQPPSIVSPTAPRVPVVPTP